MRGARPLWLPRHAALDDAQRATAAIDTSFQARVHTCQQHCACRYVSEGVIQYEDEPRCAATAAEAAELESAHAGASDDGAFHFVTQAFFLTAHALHVGARKMLEQLDDETRAHAEFADLGPHFATQARQS
jgi:Ubiquitin elongating factor core